MTRNRATQSMLREAASNALSASHWLARYERTGSAEHRLNAVRCLMDARDTLARAEVCITEGLAERETAEARS